MNSEEVLEFIEKTNADMSKYEYKALLYAEKRGIVEYEVDQNKMIYYEVFPTEGVYKAIINLDTLLEEQREKQ